MGKQFSDVITGAAVTAVTRAATGTLAIPGGKGGTLKEVVVVVYPTLETIVNAGGLVEIENGSIDWKPFQFYTPYQTCVTAGAAPVIKYNLKVKKKLPAPSTITVYYTPYDNQSQKLTVTFIWEEGSFSGPQTYIMSGIGSALTQVTIASDHVSIAIPQEKGGVIAAIGAIALGTLETIVNSGGLVTVKNKTEDPSPSSWYVGGATCVASGGVNVPIEFMQYDGKIRAPDNSTFTFDYTPQDNQSQMLAAFIIWEG